MPTIVTLPGDGIGPEVLAAALEILNVVGELANSSVSLEAIQMNRLDSVSVFLMRLDLTKCQRSSASAVAQPTHEPVEPWSPIFHQSSRRSLVLGGAAAAAARTRPAAAACSSCQSRSVSRDGSTLRIRLTFLGRPFAGRRFARFTGGMERPYVPRRTTVNRAPLASGGP